MKGDTNSSSKTDRKNASKFNDYFKFMGKLTI